jgi:hypothetical protein
MQEEKRFVTITLRSDVTQNDLVSQNRSNKLRNEKELLQLFEEYFDFSCFTEPMMYIGKLHQDFIENSENHQNYDIRYFSDVNYQIKELFLLLTKAQNLNNSIQSSKDILKLLTNNEA